MKKFASVAAYLRAVPPAPRAALQQLRKTIKAAAPQATEVISYGMPCFKHHGTLLCFAAFKDHLSLFMSTYFTKTLKKELASYHTAKGTIRFTAAKPLPAALVRKLVKARIRQNEARR
ncbi:MAG: hypothetical protein DMD52_01555 [Gemmatimonadetes bacterium]|nr:MAG: hypothetical protein DMD52_01555 [Gemmatimonadota bacterium]